jgi:hypothetical protein
MRTIMLAALLSVAATAPALAGTYTVTVRDPWSWRTGWILDYIKVKGGTVGEMPEAVKGQPFIVEVTLPDDANCFTRISLFFGRGNRSDVMGNVCSNPVIILQ